MNILLFGPEYFGYTTIIKSSLERLGHKTVVYDERHSNSTIDKVLIRLGFAGFMRAVSKYYDEIIRETARTSFDIILFLNPETIPVGKLKRLREQQNQAIFVIYLWDSLRNKRRTLELAEHFDYCFSFDPVDCDLHPRFKHHPLFFSKSPPLVPKEGSIDFVFIGTLHSDRFRVAERLVEQLRTSGRTAFIFMYVPSRLVFIREVFRCPQILTSRLIRYSFIPMERAEVERLFEEAKCILDVQHTQQSGLTVRTLESLGARKKIATTNRHIAKYSFFDSENILIIDRNNPLIPEDFFDGSFSNARSQEIDRYFIDNWVRDVVLSHKHQSRSGGSFL
jgi:hypothetical protein